LHFAGASFFIGGLLNEPHCVLWGVFFHRRSFHWKSLNEPLCVLWGASFFIGGLLNEPMNAGSDSAPLFMALIFCVKRLSNF
jgi:hypothetical protein